MRPLIEPGHPELSVRRQCALLGLNRSSLYYEPAAETAETLRLMRLLDAEYTAHPFLVSRRLTRRLLSRRGVLSGSRFGTVNPSIGYIGGIVLCKSGRRTRMCV